MLYGFCHGQHLIVSGLHDRGYTAGVLLLVPAMTKHVDFQWRVAVSAELLAGAVMDRWSEEENDMEQVGWDWRRAGHVTTILSSDWCRRRCSGWTSSGSTSTGRARAGRATCSTCPKYDEFYNVLKMFFVCFYSGQRHSPQ